MGCVAVEAWNADCAWPTVRSTAMLTCRWQAQAQAPAHPSWPGVAGKLRLSRIQAPLAA